MIDNYVNDVHKIMSKLGLKNINEDYYKNIQMWQNWYEQNVKDFYKYKVYNGFKKVECTRFSLGLPKLSCQEWASLLFNDKTCIQVGNQDEQNAQQQYLNGVFKDNLFDEKFTDLIEKTFALGTGATVVYRDAQGNAKISYVIAPMIYPLRQENGEIVDVAFVSVLGNEYYVNVHQKINGRYYIQNRFFTFANKTLQEVIHDDVMAEDVSDVKLFQIYKPNISNNIDMFAVYGMSIYGNSINNIKACDFAYDSFKNEFELGKKRIFLTSDVLQYKTVTDELGNSKQIPLFDENQTEFYAIDGAEGTPIQEVNPALRIAEHISGLQTLLNIFGNSVGFGKDHYSFDKGEVYTNTTNLINSQSQLYKNLVKHEKVLRRGIIELVKAIMYVGSGKVYTDDVTVDFDDSIIEDTAEIKRQALLELNAGLIDAVEYFVQVYKMTEKQAIEFVAKMQARAPKEEEADIEQ